MSVEVAERVSSLPKAQERAETPEQALFPGHSYAATSSTTDHTLASSPLLQDGPPQRRPPNVNTDRSDRVSAIRISQTSQQLRSNGSLPQATNRVDDADPGNETETDSAAEESALESQAEEDEDEGQTTQDEAAPVTYSKLSKRADSILANAKKKLNLLEGNLGRARHSLASPTFFPEYRSQSSLESYENGVSPSEDPSVKVAPVFKFAPPRNPNEPLTPTKLSPGHGRMFSETSVPSPIGGVTRGSRSLDLMNQGPLRSPQMNGNLDTLPENEAVEAEQESSVEGSSKERDDGSSPAPRSTRDLRDQAEELRSRIAFLQRQSRGDLADVNKGAYDIHAQQHEQVFLMQVAALQQSLEDQERVIEQLETAEQAKDAKDPRHEWQQILDKGDDSDVGSDYSDSYDDYDAEQQTELLDALEEEEFPDEAEAMAGAHEDRADAFDYEHFILHSVMGHVKQQEDSSDDDDDSDDGVDDNNESPDRDSRPGAINERGRHPQRATEDDVIRQSWDKLYQPNESMASLATTTQSFQTAQEHGDGVSDSGSDASDQRHEELLNTNLRDRWPMPPASATATISSFGRGNISDDHAYSDSRASTPTGAAPREDTARPVSRMFKALVDSTPGLDTLYANKDRDYELVHSVIENLRSVCLTLGLDGADKREVSSMRERLEVARRVLEGEL